MPMIFLCGVAILSTLLNGLGLPRAMVALAIWLEPFALLIMLLVEPPSKQQRHWLLALIGLLVATELLLIAAQWRSGAGADDIRGTLLRNGAGAHVVAGVCALAGLAVVAWSLVGGRLRMIGGIATAAALLIFVPAVTDAKQVTFAAIPAGLAMLLASRAGLKRVLVLLPVPAAVIILVSLMPAGTIAVSYLKSGNVQTGKVAALEVVAGHMGSSLGAWAVGLGPANTVSRAAFLTGDSVTHDSPLKQLGLAPAEFAVEANNRNRQTNVDTSVASTLSSFVGIFGDVGFAGLISYLLIVVAVLRRLWRKRTISSIATGAMAGWVMSFPLAFVYDWWEQAPFMLFLALMTGLALGTSGAANGSTARSNVHGRPSDRDLPDCRITSAQSGPAL
jgi:hypothetical protein